MLKAAAARARAVGLNLELPSHFGTPSPTVPPRCTDPWKVAFVRWNGEVHPCCYAPSKVVMGSLAEQSFWAIWNGEAYRALRRRVNTGTPPDYCRTCTAGRQRGLDDEAAHVVLAAADEPG